MKELREGKVKQIKDLKGAIGYSLSVIARRAISSYELKKNLS